MKELIGLTPKQEARMRPYAQEWIDECLRTGTTEDDWCRMEDGIRESYRHAGLDEPRVIVRTTSPMACVLAGPIAALLFHEVRAVEGAVDVAVGEAVGGAVEGAVAVAVEGAVDVAVDVAVGGIVGRAVDVAVGEAVDRAVGEVVDRAVDVAVGRVVDRVVDVAVGRVVEGAVGEVVDGAVGGAAFGEKVRETIKRSWNLYNGGSLWASWCAWRLFFVDECGLDVALPQAETWRKLSTGTGWWWPHKDFCIVAPRPDVLKMDVEGRLHCEDGPALLYPDGWGIWSWHGIRIPRAWIENKESLDPQTALSWENVEQRRCAAEILGWERVLQQLDTKVVDDHPNPQIGTLLEVDLPNAPRERFLRVVCGTGRHFVLPVDNSARTALEAQCSLWGEEGIDPSWITERYGVRT